MVSNTGGQALTYTASDATTGTIYASDKASFDASITTLAVTASAGTTEVHWKPTGNDTKRADLVQDVLKLSMGIPIGSIRAADGAGIGISETAGDHFLLLGTNLINLQGEVANNETEVSVSYFQFILPPEYISGGSITVRIRCKIAGAGTDNGSTVDLNVYKQADQAVGSDLCATAAATFAAKATWYNKDFVVTPTGLVSGDTINVKLSSSVIESASSDLIFYSEPPKILMDIRG